MSETTNPLDNNAVRIFAMIAAGILLNLGLFFVLIFLAPLIAGMVCGYILRHKRNGILSGFLSSVFSYSLIFAVTGSSVGFLDLIGAVLIMSLIGALGGFIGVVLQKRMIESTS